jgi:hypothetical protein
MKYISSHQLNGEAFKSLSPLTSRAYPISSTLLSYKKEKKSVQLFTVRKDVKKREILRS